MVVFSGFQPIGVGMVARGVAWAALLLAFAPAWAQDSSDDLLIDPSPPAALGPAPAGARDSAAPDAAPVAPDQAAPAEAPPANCTKADFETVVDEAAAALRDLNIKNKPTFQDKLRQLKDKRGWSEDEFLREAAPYVKDTEIDKLDGRTNDLLGRITAMGDEGSAAATPDCTMFQTLRGLMDLLVETQNNKWTYMFWKIDTELAK
jgi:hypothetical protein